MSTCRFCRKPLSIPLPDDVKIRRMVETLAKRACCDRCADYHRRRRDLVETLQRIALLFSYDKDGDRKAACIQSIRGICEKIVDHGENHYLLSGLKQHVGEFVESIREHPDKAAFQAEVFERGLADMGRQMARA